MEDKSLSGLHQTCYGIFRGERRKKERGLDDWGRKKPEKIQVEGDKKN